MTTPANVNEMKFSGTVSRSKFYSTPGKTPFWSGSVEQQSGGRDGPVRQEFLRVKAWGTLAEEIHAIVGDGDFVLFIGRFGTDVDQAEGGNKTYRPVLKASRFEVEKCAPKVAQVAQEVARVPAAVAPNPDDDLPF